LSIIALLGSVFSPYYAKARDRPGAAPPLSHCSMNVALYGPLHEGWALTERDARVVWREPDKLTIGPSAMHWVGGALAVDFDEVTAPFGARLAGQVRLYPEETGDGRPVLLDAQGHHRWWPIAPLSRAEVELSHPSLRFQGTAYLDANSGDRPLEDDFTGWTWSRVASPGRAVVTYDVERRDGSHLLFAEAFERGGRSRSGVEVAGFSIGPTLWGLGRTVHAGPEQKPALIRTLEDTPFYARSLIHASYLGERAMGTHETLSLDRFRTRWVKYLLPFRMRRER
jgi:carotenoid 1,2-hydratase